MDKIFAQVQKSDKKQTSTAATESGGSENGEKKSLPKGVVLGKDGKPCRSCTSSQAWFDLMKQSDSKTQNTPASSTSSSSSSFPFSSLQDTNSTTSLATSTNVFPNDCPADVETLGRSTWTFLHTLSASYPVAATSTQQSEMKQFLSLFSRLYPCWHCAEDFQRWMNFKEGRQSVNEPKVQGRKDFMRWMCEAHNEVNAKLGKGTFDCGEKSLEDRWGSGPEDGRCG